MSLQLLYHTLFNLLILQTFSTDSTKTSPANSWVKPPVMKELTHASDENYNSPLTWDWEDTIDLMCSEEASKIRYLLYLISQSENSANLLIIAKGDRTLNAESTNKKSGLLSYKVSGYSLTGLWMRCNRDCNLYTKQLIAKLNNPDSSEWTLDEIKSSLVLLSGTEELIKIQKFQINVNGFKVSTMRSSNKDNMSNSNFYLLKPQEDEEELGSDGNSLTNEDSSLLSHSSNTGDKELKSHSNLSDDDMYETTLTNLIDIQSPDGRIKVALEVGRNLTDEKTELGEVMLEWDIIHKLGLKVTRTGPLENEIGLLGCFPENDFFKELIEKEEKEKEGLLSKAKNKWNTRNKVNKNPDVHVE